MVKNNGQPKEVFAMIAIEDFWDKLKSSDDSVHDEGYRLWREYASMAPNYIESLKEYLPKRFAMKYADMNFHDFHILGVTYVPKQESKAMVRIVMNDYFNEYGKDMFYELLYTDVIQYSCHVPFVSNQVSWSYDIFESCGKGRFMHRILCSNRCWFDILARSIEIKVLPYQMDFSETQ